jgi:undecaprenyl pyrophosphate phosphatase UppP
MEARHLTAANASLGLATAFCTALVAGLFAIYFLVAMLRRERFHYFAPYCAVLGVLCLLWFAL